MDNTITEKDCLPCPFCGEQPRFITPSGEGSRWVQLKCCNAACLMCSVATYTNQDKVKLIRVWNQRI
jgi:hypothetical protein